MKHLFLVNPAAGKRDATEAYSAQIKACCQGLDWELKVSQKPGDITRWAREAAETGDDLRIYACGGDGTLNEVVNGVAGHDNVAITHWPGGSGNDFIKIFSDTAPFRDLKELLNNPSEAAFDLICCNGHYGINSCSVGLDARIGTEVARYKRLPLVSGSGAYILSTLANVIKGIHHPYQITLNGRTLEGGRTMIYVGSGRWYGGGFNPSPDADPTDGLLDVLLVEAVSRLTVAQVIGPYKKGQYAQYPHLIQHETATHVVVEAAAPEAIQVDGELLTAQRAEFSLAPWKIRFFYPNRVTWENRIPAPAGK